jgi:hypothetical protein
MMSEMNGGLVERLNRLLNEPVRRPEDAERAGRVAQVLAELLRASDKAHRVLAEAGGASASVQPGQSLAGKTLQDAAEAVLREAGKSLHAKELGSRIKARGWRHPRGTSRPDQIVYQLAARLPRSPLLFRRVAPNTFSLTEWGDGGSPGAPGRRPKVGLFTGPARGTGRRIGEAPDGPAGADEWRSS